MPTKLRKRIYEIYQLFSAGRLDLLADMFDENVDFRSNAPIQVFPYLGNRKGRAEVMKALWAVHGQFESVTFLPIQMVVEAETAAVIVSITITQRTTKRVIRLSAAHFLRFHEDRIVEYRAILDSFDAVQQVLGQEIDLPQRPASI